MNDDLVRKIEDKTRIRDEKDGHHADIPPIHPSGTRPCDTQTQIRRQTVEPVRRSGLGFLLCICGVIKTVDNQDESYSFKRPVPTFFKKLWRLVAGSW